VDLFQQYTQFEKQYGEREGIEDSIVSKRRFQYEESLKAAPTNYDTWFDYLRLEESNGNIVAIRELYERAIAQVPPTPEKSMWRRYIYLWVNYALFEELEAEVYKSKKGKRGIAMLNKTNKQDVAKTRQVYQACLKVIPHKQFTFAKIWLLMAQFEVRQKDLAGARQLLGRAIGMCPKDKLFKGYIELELQVL